MKAVVFRGIGDIRIEEVPEQFDRREPGWIRVKLEPLSPAVAA
jgi:hypothetical protein